MQVQRTGEGYKSTFGAHSVSDTVARHRATSVPHAYSRRVDWMHACLTRETATMQTLRALSSIAGGVIAPHSTASSHSSMKICAASRIATWDTSTPTTH